MLPQEVALTQAGALSRRVAVRGGGRNSALTQFQMHRADGLTKPAAAALVRMHSVDNESSSPPVQCSPSSTTCASSRCCVTQTQCSDTVLIAQRRQWLNLHRRGITVEPHARQMYAGRLTCTALACWEVCIWYQFEPDAQNIVLVLSYLTTTDVSLS